MRIFFSSSSDRLAATVWDVLALLDERIRTSASTSFIWLARYFSTMPRIKETASANWFVCLNSEKSSSNAFTLSSNLNKEPKVGRFCREVLGTIAGVGTGVCC
ncbi:hypothetical protein Tco_0570666 [Tanacetum coccineum]